MGERDVWSLPDEVTHAGGDIVGYVVAGGDGVIGTSPAVDHVLVARSDDPRVIKEVHVTTYHVLWELVHVFFEQPGLLTPGVIA